MSAQHPIDTRLPEMLRSGRRLRGVFNGIPSPAIVEMCAFAGFDFILLDNEHGSAGLETTENMLRAARASGIPAIVRCLEHDMARTLDLGASAVQIPMVETAAHAQALVQRIKYPTRGQPGQRGAAFSTRAAGYGAFGGVAHTQRSNDGVALIVMIETERGIANAFDIAAVPGVDAVFIGPNDLAHSMGLDNRWHEPPAQVAIESALRAISAAGACPGILALSPEEEARYGAWGARFLASNTAGILTAALREAATRGR
ncbi:HpcH/HpaI aldolase family protein [Variovorax ginsengisoli]|uniref:4-hydroxy-2-oxoheptanedioate aldolase n=1 Tax=Variovorax ginsengisoli TaxID=363844 RepID=A0ABT9S6D6_9BURK|nr:aldolase/citrate lyase family protein [Variovorax ginsengisoli]MDP9899919.1 4-hydroxy-2-oxoheptanedioate aldolase [Variovorax ginsengisoli]